MDSNSTGLKTMLVASTADSGLTSGVVTVNTATNVKASAGEVYGVSCANANASTCFVQFYNTAGSPTCGTSVIWSLALPSSGTLTLLPGIGIRNHATGDRHLHGHHGDRRDCLHHRQRLHHLLQVR